MPTKTPQDNESCAGLTMDQFCEVIPIPKHLEELLWKAASRFEGRTKVVKEKWILFEFDVTDECKDFVVASEAMADEFNRVLRMRGKQIPDMEPGEKRMVHLLELESGRYLISKNRIHILYAMRTREDGIKDALKGTPVGPELRLQIGSGKDICRREVPLLTSSAIIVYEGVEYRTEPPIPLLTLPRPVRQLEASRPAEYGTAGQSVQ